MDGAVGLHLVAPADTVLHDPKRLVIAVVELVQGDAQAVRIGRPAPGVGLEVGVFHHAESEIAGRDLELLLAQRYRRASVARERQEICRIGCEKLEVVLAHFQLDARALHLPQAIGGIVAAHLHVGIPQRVTLAFHGEQMIGGVGGIGVDGVVREHLTHHDLRGDLVRRPNRKGRRHELVVRRLGLRMGAPIRKPARHEAPHAHHVDLVEGEPVLHLALIVLHDAGGVAHEQVDELAALPTAVLVHERERGLVVRERHERFDAVLSALVKHGVVER